MDEYMSELKIPKARIAVLIGEKGEIKNKIQKKLEVKLVIDSKEGDIDIIGEDSVNILIAEKIVRAISRGFNTKHALKLINETYNLEVIDLTEFVGKNVRQTKRVKSRLIGTDGKTRKTVELLSNTKIVIYGKTISIIGDYINVGVARKAIELLLIGKTHATVYKWLEGQKRALSEKGF